MSAKNEAGVHVSHCCFEHGCKYGDRDCFVVQGKVRQRYACEVCDAWEDLKAEYGNGSPSSDDPEYIEYFESEVVPAYFKEKDWQEYLPVILQLSKEG